MGWGMYLRGNVWSERLRLCGVGYLGGNVWSERLRRCGVGYVP